MLPFLNRGIAGYLERKKKSCKNLASGREKNRKTYFFLSRRRQSFPIIGRESQKKCRCTKKREKKKKKKGRDRSENEEGRSHCNSDKGKVRGLQKGKSRKDGS